MPDNFQIILDADIKVASSVNALDSKAIRVYTKSLNEIKDKLELSLLKDLTDNQVKNVTQKLNDINHDIDKIYAEYEANLISDQKGVMGIQYDSEVGALNKVTGVSPEFNSFKVLPKTVIDEVIKTNRIINYVDNKGKPKKININREIKKLKGLTKEDFRRSIRASIIEGNNSRQTALLISKSLDRVTSTKIAQVKAITRTTMFDTLNRSKDVAEKDFEDVITGYMWVSVLDLRTTEVCASLNGKVVRKKENFPIGLPPIHWGCRSQVVPITKLSDIREVERRFSISSEKKVETRLGENKTVFKKIKDQSGTKTFKNPTNKEGGSLYDSWFKTLDQKYQKQWLGRERFDIYKKHGLKTTDLVTPQGKVLTVEQIRSNLDL